MIRRHKTPQPPKGVAKILLKLESLPISFSVTPDVVVYPLFKRYFTLFEISDKHRREIFRDVKSFTSDLTHTFRTLVKQEQKRSRRGALAKSFRSFFNPSNLSFNIGFYRIPTEKRIGRYRTPAEYFKYTEFGAKPPEAFGAFFEKRHLSTPLARNVLRKSDWFIPYSQYKRITKKKAYMISPSPFTPRRWLYRSLEECVKNIPTSGFIKNPKRMADRLYNQRIHVNRAFVDQVFESYEKFKRNPK